MARKSADFHFRLSPQLRADLTMVQENLFICADARRQNKHPKIATILIAAAEDLIGRFRRGESIVDLPQLAQLGARQNILDEAGRPTSRQHHAPFLSAELYRSLLKSPRPVTPDEQAVLERDARRLSRGPAILRGGVFTDPVGDRDDLKAGQTCQIESIKGHTAQVVFDGKGAQPINVFDLLTVEAGTELAMES